MPEPYATVKPIMAGALEAAPTGGDAQAAALPQTVPQARPEPGTGRQMVKVGSLLAMAAIVMVVIGNIAAGLLASALFPGTRVVVASRDISIRSSIGPDDLTLQTVARGDQIPAGFTRLDEVEGHGYVAQVNIIKGQQITRSVLAGAGDTVFGPLPAYLPIPQGFVASTVPTSEFLGVGGFIQTGDYINVITVISSGVFETNSSTTITQTVFTNLHVLRVGTAPSSVSSGSQAPHGSSTGASTLTVVTTQCDAEFLTWLLAFSNLKYTLGAYKDYQPQDTKPDPTCRDAASAKGVGPAIVNARWHFTDKSLGPNTARPPVPTN